MKNKTKIENDKRREIIDWAKEHNFIINPSKGMEGFVENILRFGFCPCDKEREHCPCPESITEVPTDGYCLCRLYWKDLDSFRVTLKAGEEDEQST